MSLRQSIQRKLALSTFLLAFPLSSALAQDATAVGERLKAVLSKQGTELSWTKISGDASKIVIEGATFAMAGQPGKVTLGDVTLADIKEENGGYTIGSATLPNYSVTEEDAVVDMTGIGITGLKLPAENATDPVAGLMMYDTADMESMTIKIAGKQAFAMNQLHLEITPPEDGNAMEFSGAAEKFTADLSLVEDADSKKVIDALGLQSLDGYFELSGSWQPSDGRLALDQYDISIEKAGTLGLTFDLGGYTPDFIKSLQEMQKSLGSSGGDSSAQGLAMLGLLQQLTFHSTSIRFDDDSLTGKILDYVAAQQNAKPADIANQAKAIVPFLMATLNNPELTAQVTKAVTDYLDDPQSIQISAEPDEAVPFAVIMAGAMSSSPQDLVKTLGVSVTANETELDEGSGTAE